MESKNKSVQSKKLLISWTMGFILVISSVLAVVLYVDPHARFGRNLYLPVTVSAREVKTKLYGQLEGAPNIVILGSSRAFTISPAYIEEKTGYSAFNMSVEGGRAGDFGVQLNYILGSGTKPQVLLIEVHYHTLDRQYETPNLQPLALLPYMPSKMAASVAEKSLQDTLSLQSFSDSLYTVMHPSPPTTRQTWTFEGDGMGVRKPLTQDQYTSLLAYTVGVWSKLYQCPELSMAAMERLEQVIEDARTHDIAIVLYESPAHNDLYKAANKEDPQGFEFCRHFLVDYYSSLSQDYPNVFFQDLSDYTAVINLDEAGFYDAVHLKPPASQLVVDALIPQIQNALAWARAGSR
jgi:hypothetical protein